VSYTRGGMLATLNLVQHATTSSSSSGKHLCVRHLVEDVDLPSCTQPASTG
jgi:hypothetical protein